VSYTWFGEIPNITTRKREQNLIFPVKGYGQKRFKNAPAQDFPDLWDGFRSGFQRTTYDRVVPQYRSRSSQGAIFNNPFLSVFRERTDSALPQWRYDGKPAWVATLSNGALIGDGAFNTRGQARDPENPDHAGTWAYTDPTDVESLKRLAGTKAWAAVRPPEVDALVLAAEAAETYRMLVRPWDNLWRWIESSERASRQLSKRRNGSSGPAYRYEQGRILAQLLSREWLKLRYGVWPFLKDIEGSLGILSDEPKSQRYTARGSAKSEKYLWEKESAIVDTYYTGTRRVSFERQVEVRAGVLYDYTVSTESRIGLNGISSLPRAAWEIFPFSFVGDWIVNIGDVLAALESKAGCNILSSWVSVNDKKVWFSSVYGSAPKASSTLDITGGLDHNMRLAVTTKDRSPNAPIGFAKQELILDMSKEKWRTRCLDVAAFASGFVGGKKPS